MAEGSQHYLIENPSPDHRGDQALHQFDRAAQEDPGPAVAGVVLRQLIENPRAAFEPDTPEARLAALALNVHTATNGHNVFNGADEESFEAILDDEGYGNALAARRAASSDADREFRLGQIVTFTGLLTYVERFTETANQ